MKQREIKFRAWTNRDKCWVGAFAVHMSGLWRESPNNEWTDLSKQEEIVLMQYTGLKDKNGKEIYEGDIVKGTSYRYGYDLEPDGKQFDFWGQVVFYGNEQLSWMVQDKDGGAWCLGDCVHRNNIDFLTGEIIGNVYENPELIK